MPQARRTKQREVIWQVLKRHKKFVSSQELHAILQQKGHAIGLATVYRTLKGLQSGGLVDVIRAPEGEMLFRVCADGTHHHHLVCVSCGDAVEFNSVDLENSLKKVARSKRFRLSAHEVEMFGQCERCHA
jgi:Fur family ferric uptake transcriptional regulator